MSQTTDLNYAIKQRSIGKFAEAKTLFEDLVSKNPSNALIYYHYAWLLDNMELEKEAAEKYEKAIKLGVKGEELAGCYLGLGSTYRVIGNYKKSEEILLKAIEVFPERNEFKVFLSMTKYNLKEFENAMELALNVIAKTSKDKGVKSYEKAILYYSSQLNKTFE